MQRGNRLYREIFPVCKITHLHSHHLAGASSLSVTGISVTIWSLVLPLHNGLAVLSLPESQLLQIQF